MNRQGPATQPQRSMTSNNFFGPQSSAIRGQPMANPRLTNGKIGGGTGGWGSGGPLGGAPGFSAPSRTNTLPNFAQAIGGGAPSQSSLDLSEFPSLSGGPQAQNQGQLSQTWGSNQLRQTSNPTVSAGQRQNLGGDASREPPSSTFPLGAGINDGFGSRPSDTSRPDGGQGRLAGGGGDDFPPLGGGLNGELGHGRLGNLGQDNTFGSRLNGAEDGFGLAGGDGLRSPTGSSRVPSNPGINQQLPFRDGAFPSRQAPIGQPNTNQQQSQQSGGPEFDWPLGELQPTQPASQQPQRRRLSNLTEAEKWGLPGLLATLPGRGDGSTAIVMGQDLANLGVDLDSNSPLFPTFSVPYTDDSPAPPSSSNPGGGGGGRTTAIPDFALPGAYTVTNVPPLHSRMGNFSDETLFAIFYQYTRDIMQEMAAAELYTRDWRWHKQLRQWMMKDAAMAQPLRTSERSERGIYIFFDAMGWRRERREFDLNYDHLDQRHVPPAVSA